MKRILLLGGEGYIGNVVGKFLLERGYSVVSYDKLLYSNKKCVEEKISYKNYEFIEGDIAEISKVEAEVNTADGVVLLAGLVGDPITKSFPEESKLVNDLAVQEVIKMCAKVHKGRFIFISTCSNYGLIEGNQKADEKFKLSPLSLYAHSKVAAEELLMSLKSEAVFCPTILRFATAFGLSPRMRFDLTVNEFTRELAIGKELLVFDADTWRPYCHVKDFARLIEVVLNSDKEDIAYEVFNAGGDENNATKRMIVDNILLKIPSGKVRYQEHGTDPRNYIVDFSKVKRVLGFTPEYSIDKGIEEVLEEIKSGNLDLVDENKNFYGNYQINL